MRAAQTTQSFDLEKSSFSFFWRKTSGLMVTFRITSAPSTSLVPLTVVFMYHESAQGLSSYRLHSKCNRRLMLRYCLMEEGFSLRVRNATYIYLAAVTSVGDTGMHKTRLFTESYVRPQMCLVRKSSLFNSRRLLLYREPLSGPTAHSGCGLNLDIRQKWVIVTAQQTQRVLLRQLVQNCKHSFTSKVVSICWDFVLSK